MGDHVETPRYGHPGARRPRRLTSPAPPVKRCLDPTPPDPPAQAARSALRTADAPRARPPRTPPPAPPSAVAATPRGGLGSPPPPRRRPPWLEPLRPSTPAPPARAPAPPRTPRPQTTEPGSALAGPGGQPPARVRRPVAVEARACGRVAGREVVVTPQGGPPNPARSGRSSAGSRSPRRPGPDADRRPAPGDRPSGDLRRPRSRPPDLVSRRRCASTRAAP